jgi:hypothetical protein
MITQDICFPQSTFSPLSFVLSFTLKVVLSLQAVIVDTQEISFLTIIGALNCTLEYLAGMLNNSQTADLV